MIFSAIVLPGHTVQTQNNKGENEKKAKQKKAVLYRPKTVAKAMLQKKLIPIVADKTFNFAG